MFEVWSLRKKEEGVASLFIIQLLERTTSDRVSHNNFKNLSWIFNPDRWHSLRHHYTVSIEVTR
jgi:hypothetical protein